MLIDGKIIAIVGGGPGGLSLARLLQLKGANVKVYERDVNKDVRVQGATLDLHLESGLKALDAAGLTDAFKKNYRPGADKFCIVDNNATVFYNEHSEQGEKPDFGSEHFRPEIDRGPLRNILLESLQPATVVWDSQFLGMLPEGNGWKLDFKNGATAFADIVIGADGANSKIRPFITPVKAFYAGVTAVEGNVYDSENTTPEIHALLQGGKIFAFGGSKSLIVSSKGDGSLAFYASYKTNENWASTNGINFADKVQVFNWFKKDFPEWTELWYELFDNDKSYFFPRQIHSMPLDQTWEALPNLTMLGDAAHLMPPFAGEGVNMAMLDALELSECITSDKFTNVQQAIAAYEQQMRIRAAEAAKASLDNTEALHAPDSLHFMTSMFSRQPE